MTENHCPTAIPLGLYVHLPWCLRKCPYCDFNSHPLDARVDLGGYVSALLADLDMDLPLVRERPLGSIFFGGGTPSLLPGRELQRLMRGISERLELAPDLEVTLEANPGASDVVSFAAYREAGVNRLSIGVQSFDAACLKALGRVHGPDEAMDAFRAARRAGFSNINLDLMFGLPGQTEARASDDLKAALDLGPEHLSYYQLTLEPNTAFRHSPPSLPHEDTIAAIQTAGQARLASADLGQYEISAYARPGNRCGHNLNYWEFGDYVGVGAGAHGKLTLGPGRVVRRWRQRDPARYLRNAGTEAALAGVSRQGDSDLAFEFALNALRLTEGFRLRRFESCTGLPRTYLATPLAKALSRGLLQREADWIRPTELGFRFLNDLLGLFLPDVTTPADTALE